MRRYMACSSCSSKVAIDVGHRLLRPCNPTQSKFSNWTISDPFTVRGSTILMQFETDCSVCGVAPEFLELSMSFRIWGQEIPSAYDLVTQNKKDSILQDQELNNSKEQLNKRKRHS
jgi:hypothetical protein